MDHPYNSGSGAGTAVCIAQFSPADIEHSGDDLCRDDVRTSETRQTAAVSPLDRSSRWRSSQLLSGVVVSLCALVWIGLTHNQLPQAADSQMGSVGWAFGLVLVGFLVGCVLVGYLADGGGVASVLLGGVVLSFLIEFTYDGSGKPISTYWIGVTANLLVFLSLGAVSVTIGLVFSRNRHRPDRPASTERPRPPESSGDV